MKTNPVVLKLNHLGYMELNEVRPFLSKALDELYPLTDAYEAPWETSSSDPSSSSTSYIGVNSIPS
jgi:hypothetical protein